MPKTYRIGPSHVFTFYVTVPLVVYLPGLIFAYLNGGGWNAHWFIDIYVTTEALVHLIMLNLALGLFFYWHFKKLKIEIHDSNKPAGYFRSFLCALLFLAYLEISIFYLKIPLFLLFYLALRSTNFKTTALLLLLIALFELVENSYRWPIIFLLVLATSFLNYGPLRSVLFSIIGLFFAALLLNPIKHGVLPSYSSPLSMILETAAHLNPYYMATQYFYELEISKIDMIAETIPLGKSIFDTPGLIHHLESNLSLPNDADFGSSSNSSASAIGYILIFLFILLFTFLRTMQPIFQPMFFYFLAMGPLYFRRSILNLINDSIVLMFFSILFFLTFVLLRHFKQR